MQKCFRITKTFVELELGRHRRERWVRANSLASMLSLRQQTALRWWMFESGAEEDKVAEQEERPLRIWVEPNGPRFEWVERSARGT